MPDYLPVDELKKHFQNLLEAYEQQEVALYDFIKSLWQLSDRQWHTYQLLDPEVKTRIDLVLSEIMKKKEWTQADRLICRNTLSIIGNLGLRESYTLLLGPVFNNLSDEKKADVNRLVDQVEKFGVGKIEDPYFDMGKKLSIQLNDSNGALTLAKILRRPR